MEANILVVDDSPVMTRFLRDVLEEEKHTVIISYDGRNIVELIEAHEIDIVLLDVIMPEANGYEILRLLQKTDSTRDIPVVMITNLTSALDVKKALDFGALDFVRKASEPIEVLARIHSALRLKEKQDMIKRNSQKDALTQLYNKQYFNEALEKIIKEKDNYHKGIALIMIDCDLFKQVNDNYGHTSGDMVLAAIANTIYKSVKASDVSCRFGGEEFSVITPNSTAFQAYAIAERIRNNIEKMTFSLQGEDVSITISCGVSHMSRDEEKTSLKLVNEADLALYKAKNNGRNQIVLFENEEQERA